LYLNFIIKIVLEFIEKMASIFVLLSLLSTIIICRISSTNEYNLNFIIKIVLEFIEKMASIFVLQSLLLSFAVWHLSTNTI